MPARRRSGSSAGQVHSTDIADTVEIRGDRLPSLPVCIRAARGDGPRLLSVAAFDRRQVLGRDPADDLEYGDADFAVVRVVVAVAVEFDDRSLARSLARVLAVAQGERAQRTDAALGRRGEGEGPALVDADQDQSVRERPRVLLPAVVEGLPLRLVEVAERLACGWYEALAHRPHELLDRT